MVSGPVSALRKEQKTVKAFEVDIALINDEAKQTGRTAAEDINQVRTVSHTRFSKQIGTLTSSTLKKVVNSVHQIIDFWMISATHIESNRNAQPCQN